MIIRTPLFSAVYVSDILSFYYDSSSLSAADAESSKTSLSVSLSHFVDQSDEDSAAGCSDRVSECDCSAVYVQLSRVDSQILTNCQ